LAGENFGIPVPYCLCGEVAGGLSSLGPDQQLPDCATQ